MRTECEDDFVTYAPFSNIEFLDIAGNVTGQKVIEICTFNLCSPLIFITLSLKLREIRRACFLYLMYVL